MKPGHPAGLVHTDNHGDTQANPTSTEQAKHALFERLEVKKIMLFELLIPYISLYTPNERI